METSRTAKKTSVARVMRCMLAVQVVGGVGSIPYGLGGGKGIGEGGHADRDGFSNLASIL